VVGGVEEEEAAVGEAGIATTMARTDTVTITAVVDNRTDRTTITISDNSLLSSCRRGVNEWFGGGGIVFFSSSPRCRNKVIGTYKPPIRVCKKKKRGERAVHSLSICFPDGSPLLSFKTS
jgi:hypothetical protein